MIYLTLANVYVGPTYAAGESSRSSSAVPGCHFDTMSFHRTAARLQ